MKNKRFGALLGAVIAAAALAAAGTGASAAPKAHAAGLSPSAALARAKAAIKPFTGHASPFPVTAPLKRKLPAGSKIAFMDCGTPVCALFYSIVSQAAKAMGVTLLDEKAGATASTVNAAFNTVAQIHPAAIINTALDPIEWLSALKKIKAEHIPIASTGVIDGAKYGLTTYPNSTPFGAAGSSLAGKLQADWVYVHYGRKASIEYNWVPELSFAALLLHGFQNEMAKLCASCVVRPLQIPVTDLGNTAPNLIVSDLQAHPSTNVVVGSNSENLLGLPSALAAAGIKVATLGSAATPTNLQYLKDGKQTADLSLDLPVLSWTLVDAAVRGATHQPIGKLEAVGYPPQEFLTKASITFNPAGGWSGYPNFPQRFMKLWAAAK